jgi:M6 family metalloprotease-like protein
VVRPLAAQRAPAAAARTGAQPYITLLIRFADIASVPRDLAYYQGLMGDRYPGVDHWYRETSGGAMTLAGSQVRGWYTLPHPRAYYEPGDDTFALNEALADAVRAADADVHFPSYAGINLIFADRIYDSYWGMGMRKTVSADGASRSYGVTWLQQAINQTLVAHEIGHTLGWMHSSGPYRDTYDSEWDVMSYWHGIQHPIYGWVAPGTIGYHKDVLGWLPADRVYTAPDGTSKTLRLERLQLPGSSDYLLARIPLANGRFYTVETRLKAGYDHGLPGEGVLIHLVDEARGDRVAQVVDGDRNGNPNDAGAVWLPGETFTDRAHRVTVQVLEATGTGYVITVTRGGVRQGRLSVSPARLDFGTVRLGKQRSRTFRLRNTGTAPLVVQVGGVPSPFQAPAGPLTLPPGGAQAVNVTFAPGSKERSTGSLTLTLASGPPRVVTLKGCGR